MVLMSQLPPGDQLHDFGVPQLKKADSFVVDPQTACIVLGNGKHVSTWNTAYRNEPAILQVANPTECGDPDPPARILKQRLWVISVELSVFLGTAGARNCNLCVVPAVQATKSGNPNVT